MLYELFLLTLVAILWGGTNPFLKKNTSELESKNSKSNCQQFKYLITNLGVLIPLVLNQLGSVLYFYTLQEVDVTLAVPVSNSLTFVFTAIVAWILGEKSPEINVVIGISLIFAGTILCAASK